MKEFISKVRITTTQEVTTLTEKKGIDLEHLMFVDESQVPVKAKRYTPYRELLKRIKRGKALVISGDQANIETTRAGVRRLQEKGEFKKVQMVQRTRPDGKRVLYIVNPSEEETEKKTPPLHL